MSCLSTLRTRRKLTLSLLAAIFFLVSADGPTLSANTDREGLESAIRFLRGGGYLEAIGAFRELAHRGAQPETRAQALVHMGDIYSYFLDDHPRALVVYRQAIDQYGGLRETANAYFNVGMILFEQNQPRRAASFFEEYLKRFPMGSRRDTAQFMAEKCRQAPLPSEMTPEPSTSPDKNTSIAALPPDTPKPSTPTVAPSVPSPPEGPMVTRLELPRNPIIRVLVDDDRPLLKVGASGALTVWDAFNPKKKYSIPKAGAVVIEPQNGALSVRGTRFTGNSLRLTTEAGGVIHCGKRAFRGELVVSRNASGQLQVVNVLPLEHYLYGVVPKEVAPEWPMEALKAQAVAARTYALFMIMKGEDRPYDVVSTTMSQVYGGAGVEHARSNAAVDETAGQVLTYSGKPIMAYFHSNSGGRTTDAGSVWFADVPYLTGVDDPYSVKAPNHVWENRLELDWIRSRLNGQGYDLGGISKIEATEFDESGRVMELRIIHEKGELRLSGNQFRIKVGATKIRSTWFKMKRDKSRIILNGKGYGHGVGMSQWGAYEMALEGHSYDAILRHYYGRVRLSRAK